MLDPMINLAVVGPYHNLFTYRIKSADAHNLQKGCRFLVPFGKTLKVGFFVGFQTEPVDYKLRFIRERIDTFSPFPEYLFDFCLWMTVRNISDRFQLLAIPSQVRSLLCHWQVPHFLMVRPAALST